MHYTKFLLFLLFHKREYREKEPPTLLSSPLTQLVQVLVLLALPTLLSSLLTLLMQVLVLLALPTFISSLCWLLTSCCNRQQTYTHSCSILLLLILSLPSPVFL